MLDPVVAFRHCDESNSRPQLQDISLQLLPVSLYDSIVQPLAVKKILVAHARQVVLTS